VTETCGAGGSVTTAGPYAYPHSFVRLANGDRLATYQKKIEEAQGAVQRAMRALGR